MPLKKIALSAIGALCALALIFVFNPPQPVEKTFPVAFFHEKSDRLPLSIPHRNFLMEMAFPLFDEAWQANPGAFNPPSGTDAFIFDVKLYEEFLQRLLIDWIASRHGRAWRMEIYRVNSGSVREERWSPSRDASAYESTVLTSEDLEQKFKGNRFARGWSFGPGTLALPKGMSLTIEGPQGNIPRSEIRLKDCFCELTITTTHSGGGVGLGSYTILLDLPLDYAQQHYWSDSFVVRVNASFKCWLSGHPSMAAHRVWAEQIIQGLENAFSEELIWRQAVEDVMLYKHSPTQYPRMPLGAHRATARQQTSR